MTHTLYRIKHISTIARQTYHYASMMRCSTATATEFTETASDSTKTHWRRQVGALWRSIGMNNRDSEQMVQRGENKPLFRKYNVLSVRISELRELFPNANIARMVKLMPSLLSDDVHTQLVNKRYELDRSLFNFDIDGLITEHPFILCKDIDFIGRNKDNLKELLEINDTEFKIMLDAKPELIMFDARRGIAVKYQLIAQYFQQRIQHDTDNLYKAYNSMHMDSDIDDDDGEGNDDGDDSGHDEHGQKLNRKSLKFLQYNIGKEEKNKLKWSIVRNPEILLSSWGCFGRIEFVTNHKSLHGSKLSVWRLFELQPQRMHKKFPEYSEYLKKRLESDGGCDRQKLQPLTITDLEEAMGELICLEHYPRSSEVDEHLLQDLEDERDEDDEEHSNETTQQQ